MQTASQSLLGTSNAVIIAVTVVAVAAIAIVATILIKRLNK
jgi:hypothetical protein